MTESKIAVIGLSGRFSGCDSVSSFWEMVRRGESSIIQVPAERWDYSETYTDGVMPGKTYSKVGGFLSGAECFDTEFFGIDREQAQLMDPQQRLLLQEAWRTIEDTGYRAAEFAHKQVSVYVGARDGDYHQSLLGRPDFLSPDALAGKDTSFLASRVAHFLDFKGPALTVNTACSSSGVAVHLACRDLLSGDSEMALAGGVYVMSTPQRFLMHSRTGLLSRSGVCRVFDDDADGFVLGEAVGFLALKRLDEALAAGDSIYGVISSSEVSHGGSAVVPDYQGQAALVERAIRTSGVDPETISYVEAHGSGTRKGDRLEFEALTGAFRKFTAQRQFCALASTKANLGYSITASTLPAIVKSLLCLRDGVIPPIANCSTPNRDIDFENSPFFCNTEELNTSPQAALVSSLSYSGTNVALVLEAPPKISPQVLEQQERLVVLSARTATALKRQIDNLKGWIEAQEDDVELADVSRTLCGGRTHFEHRLAWLVTDGRGLHQELQVLSGFTPSELTEESDGSD